MTPIFADACYWIALLNPKDQLHGMAKAAHSKIGGAGLCTTDEVLTELLNFYSSRGPQLRKAAHESIEGIRMDPHVEVVPQSRASFDSALAVYGDRRDKEYSLVDCRSFEFMRTRGVSEVLSSDHHFEQEGFILLLKPE